MAKDLMLQGIAPEWWDLKYQKQFEQEFKQLSNSDIDYYLQSKL